MRPKHPSTAQDNARRPGRPQFPLTHITRSRRQVCGSGIHRPQRQTLHPKSPFLPRFCWLGHGLSPQRTQLGRQGSSPTRQSGHPEPHCPLSEGENSPPFKPHSQRAGTPAAWERSCQGPGHLGHEAGQVTWRIPHFLSSQLSTVPIAEPGDLSRMLT